MKPKKIGQIKLIIIIPFQNVLSLLSCRQSAAKNAAVLPRLQRVKIKERLPGGIRLVLLAKAFIENGGR
jgi:hypothetical protein